MSKIETFKEIFDRVWYESDLNSKGHSDYWNKMKLRVRQRLDEELKKYSHKN